MVTATRQVPVALKEQMYSARIVRSESEIRELANKEPLLRNCESTLRPRFFLASASQNWIPRLVVVTRGDELAGILYTKEKKLAGISTGLVYVDTTLGSILSVNDWEREAIFRAALEALLKRRGVRGMRIVIPPSGFEMVALKSIPSEMTVDLYCAPTQNHSLLVLPDRYETFLDSLGSQTRRNFRYYRRRSQAAHHRFVDKLSIDEFASAAMALQTETLIKSGSKAIKRAIDMISAAERPLLVGLRHENGEWLSILGGWYEAGRAVIFLQMNSDKRHRTASLSIVLRGYLIELFILRGVRNVVFWAGSGGQLSRYSVFLPAVAVHLDQRSFVWKIVRHTMAPVLGLLPGPLAKMAEWIVPPKQQQNFDAQSVSKGDRVPLP